MTSRRRILILDDETKVAFFLQESLEALGRDYEVVSVSSSGEALRKVSHERFDLLVTDQPVPSMNGLELFERLRQLQPDAPLILISAYSPEDGLAQARSLGAYRYFTKPFRIEDFVQSVVEVLEDSGRQQSEPLSERRIDALADRLEALRREVGAQCVLASTTGGRLLARSGILTGLDPDQLLQLAADDFAASLALAHYLGGDQTGNLTYYEGATHDIYFAIVEEDLFLVMIFDRRVQASRIGIVWLYASRAIQNLRRVWAALPMKAEVD